MALTETHRDASEANDDTMAPTQAKIWVLQYGPCLCRADAGEGSFDFVRFRTAEVQPEALDRHLIIVSDRVVVGAGHLLYQVNDGVPAPKLVVSTGHCPAARRFWDELPGGWIPVEEVLEVDLRVEVCISGFPEMLLAAVLGRLHDSTSDARPETVAPPLTQDPNR